ncbi:MAG: ATP-binding protein [Kineosporiaceae bacterium]|nr:ATP-binding protein [Kineosporiaceae bacterium]
MSEPDPAAQAGAPARLLLAELDLLLCQVRGQDDAAARAVLADLLAARASGQLVTETPPSDPAPTGPTLTEPSPTKSPPPGESPAGPVLGSPLGNLAERFGLSTFERGVLLLTVAREVGVPVGELTGADGHAHAQAAAHAQGAVSFARAMALLPEGHWSALSPVGPLRRWQLVHLLDPTSVAHSPMVADERVLHHLLGTDYLDPDVAALVRPVEALTVATPTLVRAAARVVQAWDGGRGVVVHGPQRANLSATAAAAAQAAGRRLMSLDVAELPADPVEREALLRKLERESALSGAAWAFEVADRPPSFLGRVLAGLDAPVVALADSDGHGPAMVGSAGVIVVPVGRLPVHERSSVLADCIIRSVPASSNGRAGMATPRGGRAASDRGRRAAPRGMSAATSTATTSSTSTGPSLAEEIDSAATVFDLPVADLALVADRVGHGAAVWDACRQQSRRRFDGLARVVQPARGWADLVLPAATCAQLQALVDSVRQRRIVHDQWGFAAAGVRGLGSAALFAGASGTGKTLAAEVVAGELGLDLLVIDLSQVVSKYIGETEKHLARVFEAAEDSGAVLLFDEADVLFGRRTEVRDSHDRYANLEVGYLLQRVESFRGLTILTTNARTAIDPAFLRRLRVVVSFPYPDATARGELWRKAFPTQTPVSDLDFRSLSTIDLPGGGIAAAALTAAYLGAANGAVRMQDVIAATKWELAKNGRTATAR